MFKYYRRNPIALFYLYLIDYFLLFFLKRRNNFFKLSSEPSKILLVNPGHLGDILISSALIDPIKKKLPKSSISFVTSSAGMTIIKSSTNIDKIYCLDHWSINRTEISWLSKVLLFYNQLKKVKNEIINENFDVIINLYRFSPNLLLYLGLINKVPSIGFSSAGLSPLMVFYIDPFRYHGHEIELQLRLFEKWLPEESVKINSLTPHQPYIIDSFDNSSKPGGRYVVLNPISGDSNKSWPINSWICLANRLLNIGFKIIFVGKGKYNDEICYNLYDKNCINLINKTTLKELSNLLANSCIVVSLDSMVAHLAAAYSCKTVVISTGIAKIHEWHPLNLDSTVITYPVNCSPCYTKPCKERPCINNITVDDVFNEIKKKLT
jgi:ADP-heptose:LPS heptosyltransferase